MSNFSNERLDNMPGEYGDTYIVPPDSQESAGQASGQPQVEVPAAALPYMTVEGAGAPYGQVSKPRPYIVFDLARQPMLQLGGDLQPYRQWQDWFKDASAKSSPEAVWEALDKLLPPYWGNMYRSSQYAESADFNGFFAQLFEQQNDGQK